jgi:hypothetical protein
MTLPRWIKNKAKAIAIKGDSLLMDNFTLGLKIF